MTLKKTEHPTSFISQSKIFATFRIKDFKPEEANLFCSLQRQEAGLNGEQIRVHRHTGDGSLFESASFRTLAGSLNEIRTLNNRRQTLQSWPPCICSLIHSGDGLQAASTHKRNQHPFIREYIRTLRIEDRSNNSEGRPGIIYFRINKYLMPARSCQKFWPSPPLWLLAGVLFSTPPEL